MKFSPENIDHQSHTDPSSYDFWFSDQEAANNFNGALKEKEIEGKVEEFFSNTTKRTSYIVTVAENDCVGEKLNDLLSKAGIEMLVDAGRLLLGSSGRDDEEVEQLSSIGSSTPRRGSFGSWEDSTEDKEVPLFFGEHVYQEEDKPLQPLDCVNPGKLSGRRFSIENNPTQYSPSNIVDDQENSQQIFTFLNPQSARDFCADTGIQRLEGESGLTVNVANAAIPAILRFLDRTNSEVVSLFSRFPSEQLGGTDEQPGDRSSHFFVEQVSPPSRSTSFAEKVLEARAGTAVAAAAASATSLKTYEPQETIAAIAKITRKDASIIEPALNEAKGENHITLGTICTTLEKLHVYSPLAKTLDVKGEIDRTRLPQIQGRSTGAGFNR